jgi:anthranilate synthase component 1
MLCDTIIIFDHIFQTIKIVSHVFASTSSTPSDLAFTYQTAVSKVRRAAKTLLSNVQGSSLGGLVQFPSVHQPPIPPKHERPQAVSNVGKAGYEAFVTKLKQHIIAGDIIQAVPSQRLAKPTALHPFNAYRHLRQVNPSPYMFYLDCGEMQLVGASPETLCKVEGNKVWNHAIAGTVKRGKNKEGLFLSS